MRILVVSSSLDVQSRSERLAKLCAAELTQRGCKASLVTLKDCSLPAFDSGKVGDEPVYRSLHAAVTASDGLVLASPIYNWECCSELKKFIEHVGSTPPDGSLRGAFFDKIVTFVNAAGLPHSYMAFAALANSMMLDFKCIINPYNVYAHDRHWNGEELSEDVLARLRKSMSVMLELTTLLKPRNYRSSWEI